MSDTTLEDDLIRTLRFRYANRHETKKHLYGLKNIRQAIRELRFYRHNREMNPAKHAYLDSKFMQARRENFSLYEHTNEQQQQVKNYHASKEELTQKVWITPLSHKPPPEPEQLSLF